MPSGSGLAGTWVPGVSDPIKDAGPRSFACARCWGVHSTRMANKNGWNHFITHISGGLLYGRDVPRPKGVYPITRKRRKYNTTKRRTQRAGGGDASGMAIATGDATAG